MINTIKGNVCRLKYLMLEFLIFQLYNYEYIFL